MRKGPGQAVEALLRDGRWEAAWASGRNSGFQARKAWLLILSLPHLFDFASDSKSLSLSCLISEMGITRPALPQS